MEAAQAWLGNEQIDYGIVCATPDMTDAVLEKLLKGWPEHSLLDVVGKYEPTLAQQWLDIGLNGFLFAGQNKIEKLHAIYDTWKGDVDDE